MDYIGQKGQDRWVIENALPGLRGGYFLDLAATDGVCINNTLLLERELGWTGICIEPNIDYFNALKVNRSCICVSDCVDEGQGEVVFISNGELGGIVADDTDNNPAVRPTLLSGWEGEGKLQTLATRPLGQILDEHRAPPVIDYLSFDVEGAETRILRSFPFERYAFLALTIERPTPEINTLLFNAGYLFVKNVSFDSFYIHPDNPNAANIARESFEQVPAKNW